MSTLYSVGQMNQLGDALEAEGFTPDDVTKLKQFSNLAGIRGVINGLSKIVSVAEDATRVITINKTTIVVDLGASPKLPFNGTEVEKHIGIGWGVIEKRADGLYVNDRKVILHLSEHQMGDKWLKGYELREELTSKHVLNANILDALYQNIHLIPEDWKKNEDGDICFVFFWESIFRDSNGRLFVRCLCFHDGGWRFGCGWIGGNWYCNNPAAVRAS